jgi:uncharacterized membrane protein
MTIWNVVLGIIVMAWAFGFGQMRQMLTKKGRQQVQAQEEAPA